MLKLNKEGEGDGLIKTLPPMPVDSCTARASAAETPVARVSGTIWVGLGLEGVGAIPACWDFRASIRSWVAWEARFLSSVSSSSSALLGFLQRQQRLPIETSH